MVESALRLLGVSFPVTDFKACVESAYRRLAVALHPDKGGSPEAFRLAKQARDVCTGNSAARLSWSEADEACRRLCADPRLVSVYASGEIGGNGLASSPWNLAKAQTEIVNLRAQAAMAEFQRQTQHRLDEERERRLEEEKEAQRRRQEEEEKARLRRLCEEKRKDIERRLRELEVQRQREKDLERQARESLRARQREAARRDQEEARGSGAAEPETQHFKHYVPRIWPAMSTTQVKKKEACLKKLRSLRTMRKRGQDKRQDDRVAACNRRIEVVPRDAWGLYRAASGQ